MPEKQDPITAAIHIGVARVATIALGVAACSLVLATALGVVACVLILGFADEMDAHTAYTTGVGSGVCAFTLLCTVAILWALHRSAIADIRARAYFSVRLSALEDPVQQQLGVFRSVARAAGDELGKRRNGNAGR